MGNPIATKPPYLVEYNSALSKLPILCVKLIEKEIIKGENDNLNTRVDNQNKEIILRKKRLHWYPIEHTCSSITNTGTIDGQYEFSIQEPM